MEITRDRKRHVLALTYADAQYELPFEYLASIRRPPKCVGTARGRKCSTRQTLGGHHGA